MQKYMMGKYRCCFVHQLVMQYMHSKTNYRMKNEEVQILLKLLRRLIHKMRLRNATAYLQTKYYLEMHFRLDILMSLDDINYNKDQTLSHVFQFNKAMLLLYIMMFLLFKNVIVNISKLQSKFQMLYKNHLIFLSVPKNNFILKFNRENLQKNHRFFSQWYVSIKLGYTSILASYFMYLQL